MTLQSLFESALSQHCKRHGIKRAHTTIRKVAGDMVKVAEKSGINAPAKKEEAEPETTAPTKKTARTTKKEG